MNEMFLKLHGTETSVLISVLKLLMFTYISAPMEEFKVTPPLSSAIATASVMKVNNVPSSTSNVDTPTTINQPQDLTNTYLGTLYFVICLMGKLMATIIFNI